MTNCRRSPLVAIAAAVALALLAVGVAPAAAKEGSCAEIRIDVELPAGAPAPQTVAATYCAPATWAAGPRRADVLVAGATYDRSYWDWPQDPQTYSYVDRTLAAGRATFAFDRLGTGASTRPASSALTVSSEAYVLHQLISWVRTQGIAEVNAIGHSLGSVTLTKEAAQWHDSDRVVVTGILHLPGEGLNSTGFATSLYPALLDPAFPGLGLDAGYLTTLPGRRGPDFYDPATADPAVVTYDEQHKSLATTGETLQAIAELTTPPALNGTRSITAPVLVVMGATDNIFCNLLVSCATASSIRANELPYYSGAAHVEAISVPHTAHNLTLHPSAPASFAAIDAWLRG